MHEHAQGGRVEVATGSTVSGKTGELLGRVRRAEVAGQSVAAVTSALDDHGGGAAVGSHGGREWEATVVDGGEAAHGARCRACYELRTDA